MELSISTEIPRFQNKEYQNSIITRHLVEHYMAIRYQGLVRIYTDGSNRRGSRSFPVSYTAHALRARKSINQWIKLLHCDKSYCSSRGTLFCPLAPCKSLGDNLWLKMRPITTTASINNGPNYERGQSSLFCHLSRRPARLSALNPCQFTNSGKRTNTSRYYSSLSHPY